jgi:uracil-DNA glycosylase
MAAESDLFDGQAIDKADSAARFIPPHPTLKKLREAAAHCTACPLYRLGTQTVFGEGPEGVRLMLVGEQPGDYEDRAGQPFVGPAGQLLDRALAEAGLDRSKAYVTNVVKHFKWTPRGKRRIHSKPNSAEVAACLPWLQAELEVIAPEALVCLGATAAQALLGRDFRVTRQRGTFIKSNLAPHVLATVHPSSLLRLPPQMDAEAEFKRFVSDLRKVAEVLGH